MTDVIVQRLERSGFDTFALAKHPYLSFGRSDLIAHRGVHSADRPGNAWAAFERAAELGVDHLAIEVQVTADGHVVIFHGKKLDDLTTGSGTIRSHRWDDLADVRYVVDGKPTGHRLVLLDHVLACYSHSFFLVDVMTDAAVRPTVEILREHAAFDRICVSASSRRRLKRLRLELGPHWCSSFSPGELAVARAAAAVHLPVPRFGNVAIGRPSSDPVNQRFVRACHRREIDVHAWRGSGADAVITDRLAAA